MSLSASSMPMRRTTFRMWYNSHMKTCEQQHASTSSTASPRKNPREETNDEALARFIRGSWYWALAAYVAAVTFRVATSYPPILWSDIYDITILAVGFYIFYLMIRMQFEDRIPPLPSDNYD